MYRQHLALARSQMALAMRPIWWPYYVATAKTHKQSGSRQTRWNRVAVAAGSAHTSVSLARPSSRPLKRPLQANTTHARYARSTKCTCDSRSVCSDVPLYFTFLFTHRFSFHQHFSFVVSAFVQSMCFRLVPYTFQQRNV